MIRIRCSTTMSLRMQFDLSVWRIYFYSVIRISWDCFGEIYIYTILYSKFTRIARLYDLNCARGTVERFNGFHFSLGISKGIPFDIAFSFYNFSFGQCGCLTNNCMRSMWNAKHKKNANATQTNKKNWGWSSAYTVDWLSIQ